MCRVLLLFISLCLVTTSTGCYYAHLAEGQLSILWQRQPIEEAIEDDTYSKDVRRLLGLVDEVREFARDLGLEVGGQYTSYVDWPGDRIVTTLVRTYKGRLEVDPWWYPFLGELPYKGYFDRERAEAAAAKLRKSGRYDVCVSGVTAYSTLGWLDDPVTRPMLLRGAASLVETLFHELVHATAFVPGDADFNEGVAQFIGQQATIRFFDAIARQADEASSPWPEPARVRAAIEDRRMVAETILAFREAVEAIDGTPDREIRRSALEARARETIAALPLEVYEPAKAARTARLSDACVALRGAYVRDLPRHAAVLEALDGDLSEMIDRLRAFADDERATEAFFVVAGARR